MDITEIYEIYKKHTVVTTDSRDCPEGSIFVALKGEKFDGNQYAVQALEKGCSYAIVDSPEFRAESVEYACTVPSSLAENSQLSTLNSSLSMTACRRSKTWHASTADSSTYQL